ncbi:MAG: heavy metal translocating P-type ATPase [Haloarculaceae archaeon]
MTSCSFCGRSVEREPVYENGDPFCSAGCLDAAGLDGTSDDAAADALAGPAANRPDDAATAYFSMRGMHTRACESYLEGLATDVGGVHDAAASYTAELIRVEYDPAVVAEPAIRDALSSRGYRAQAPEPGETPADRNAFDFEHLRAIFSVIAVSPIAIIYVLFFYPVYLGWLPTSSLDNPAIVSGLYGPVAMFTTITVFGVGFPILRSAAISLHERRLTVDVLLSLTVLAAYAYSMASLFLLDRLYLFFDVTTALVVIATIGTAVRARFERRAIRTLADVVDDAETTARRLTSAGETETVPTDECAAGDRLLVRPGERIPLDGTVVDGRGAVDEALITGEARPQRTVPGDTVVGGSIAVDGAFEIAVDSGATSTLDRLRELVWERQTDRAPAGRLVDRVAAAYVPVVLALAVVTVAAWLAAGATARVALRTGLTVLIVACPVAMGLVTPLSIGRGRAAAADRGVPILDGTVLERASDAAAVAFDKTGTLTTGEMRVTGVDAAEPVGAETLLRRAAAVESRSSHPIAAAIRERAPDSSEAVSDFERRRDGVLAAVDGSRTAVGSPALFDELGWETPPAVDNAIAAAHDRGDLPTVVGWDGAATGVVALGDVPRDDWAATVERLAADGRSVAVLTGDDSRAARRFADHPAVEHVYADVPPEAKGEIVRRLRADGPVAMVGDGTNDAPALAAADVGVAMVSGTDFSATVADALVTADALAPVDALFAIARATRRRLRETLALALAAPAVGLPLAALGLVTPLVATGVMAAGTVLVLANSSRSLAVGS